MIPVRVGHEMEGCPSIRAQHLRHVCAHADHNQSGINNANLEYCISYSS